MTPSAVDAVDAPIVAGGGVSDGRGLLAILALGAQGVVIGTRLMATQECPIHDNLKNALVDASEVDTMLIMRSLNSTHRVWRNKAAKHVLELESGAAGDPSEIFNAAAGAKAKEMYDDGVLDVGVISCGQGVGLFHDIPTVQDLFDGMVAEAESLASKLAS
jgi:nitronate monooxygenase